MRKTTRIICLIICMAMSLALFAGCGGNGDGGSTNTTPTPPASTGGGEKTPPPADAEYVEDLIVLGGDKIPVIDTGNPAYTVSQSAWISNMVFNNLVKFTIDGEYVPALATEWDSDDYQNFTFKLRDDVYFHNGEKFTAEDVAFTIDRAKEALGTQAYDRYSKVESYEIVNDYEIKLTLAKVAVDFIDDIAWPNACILSKKAVESDPEKGTWIGTGPWTVKEFVSNEYVLLARNDDYWGEIPKTKTINIKYVAEISARRIMLETGEAHAVYGIDPVDYPAIEADPRFDAKKFVLNNTAFLGFNMKDPLMSDINFRMAVAHAIKREDCVNITRNGYAVPVDSGTFWGYRTEFKNTDIPIIPYDLDKAKEYLDKSSYNGETVEIVAAMADPIKNAQVFQANLSDIGIKVEVRETDSPGLASYAAWGNTNVQMISGSGGWSFKGIASRPYYYPGSATNRTNYDNPEVAALYDEAGVTVDDAKREAIYREIQEIVNKDIPCLGIFNMEFIVACQQGVDGMGLYSNMCHDLSYMYMVKK
jgi:peptide/nickel transport system substrate-binding protein